MNVVLYKPEIPPNTGNIGRLCVNTGSALHIVGKPAFDMSEKAVRRAGLDYWPYLQLFSYENWDEFYGIHEKKRIFLISRFGNKKYYNNKFEKDDFIMFGSETSGVPDEIRNCFTDGNVLKIPMKDDFRSINLSNAVAIVLYEAVRQTGMF